jgi:glycosyltransferase involved in cell wall biosynthesis
MRALVVSHEWEAQRPGGAQRSASALARGLAQAGHDVVLASAVRPGGLVDAIEPTGNQVQETLVISETSGSDFRWADPAYADNWADVIGQVQPDVVHLHHYYHIGIDLPLLARRLAPDAAVVMTLHEYLAICLMSGQMVDRLGHLCPRSSVAACAECVMWTPIDVAARQHYVATALGHVDAFVTPSHFARLRYGQWGLDPARLHVIPNALDLPARADRPERRPGPFRLTYIGQHTPFKGVELLLAAVEIVAERAPGAIAPVRVFGGGSEQFGADFAGRLSRARDRCRSLATFAGEYRPEDVAGILDDTDAIVVPSTWWENSPVVIEEALARRVPVICSDIGGMAERVRHGVDGWHFPVGNATALAELIIDLAGRWPVDLPGMRRPASLETVTRQHLALYSEAIAARKANRTSERR